MERGPSSQPAAVDIRPGTLPQRRGRVGVRRCPGRRGDGSSTATAHTTPTRAQRARRPVRCRGPARPLPSHHPRRHGVPARREGHKAPDGVGPLGGVPGSPLAALPAITQPVDRLIKEHPEHRQISRAATTDPQGLAFLGHHPIVHSAPSARSLRAAEGADVDTLVRDEHDPQARLYLR
jgi:hypothetical protein